MTEVPWIFAAPTGANKVTVYGDGVPSAKGYRLQDTKQSLPNVRFWMASAKGILWLWLKNGTVYKEEHLIYIQDLWIRYRSLSSNRRYLFLALYADTAVLDTATRKLIFLERSQRFADGSYTLAVNVPYHWSPDSRFILVSSPAPVTDLLLYSVNPVRRQELVRSGVWQAGWSPDGRSIWHAQSPSPRAWEQTDERLALRYYRRALRGGRWTRMAPQEVRRLLTDWRWLAFGWQKGLGDRYESYAYTLDGLMRVGWGLEGVRNEISVEWWSGKRKVLKVPSEARVRGVDLSADRRYLLVEEGLDGWWVAEIETGRWWRLISREELPQGTALLVEFVPNARLYELRTGRSRIP